MSAQSLESLLVQSIGQYQDLLKSIEQIEGKLDLLNSDSIVELVGRMEDMLHEIKQCDERIMGSPESRQPPQISSLLARRHALMEQIVARQQFLFPKIDGIMAVQKIELNKLRKGIQTMNRYSPPGKKSGGLINQRY